MWNLKRNDTNELTYKTGREPQTWKTNLQLPGGGMGEGIVGEFWMDICTLLCLKWIADKDLLCNILNSAQCCVVTQMGGEFGEEWLHVYV